ncbi:LysR family transcriptional regulator [Thermomonospora curvata]|uniref:Transcriptional regulator, LysR family n=1 Tax=Thermomonospora curvata (strain ATCC 19995 / DSM 43183 / JCM 3096 / KCTC 9072 / NBRC 15933 / NCIMB 10081 / Henssen B9) TaxID=471852 RepID=D1AAI6_THECD|nr:LysR family transcriptional regulator [Thermomonospora curvata]ACY98899.1 transcriptional regulator, LysR family [Thermomonospora curvata DSM 43183]
MDLSLLRTFLEVYRAGSLTGAAPHLGLSQPAVTAQIRTLEERLGRQLFQRTARGVVPTAVADELARQVAPHVDALVAITERRIGPGDPFARPVHLGGPAEFTAVRVLPALAEPVRRGLRLRVGVGLAEELLSGLAAGRFDLVVSAIRPRGRAITAVPLTDEEFVLVAAACWAERIDREHLAREPAAALRGVPLISYAEDLPIIRRYWRTVFGGRPSGQAAVVVPDLRGVLAAAAAGAGVTVLPRYLCEQQLASGELVALLQPEVPPINTLFLAARTGTADLPHIAAVRDHLLAQARSW